MNITTLDDALDFIAKMTKDNDSQDFRDASALLSKDVRRLRDDSDFYKQRCHLLHLWQSRMRDPERTLVCDILANGQALPAEFDSGRYGDMRSNTPFSRKT